MATHAETLTAPLVHQHRHNVAGRLFRAALDRFLLLPLGAAIALIWANTEPETYFRFARQWAFAVNEIAMAFFLALIAQELHEALMPGGALAKWRHRTLPIVAALGGLIGSAAAFFSIVNASHQQMLAAGWPVVVAVDIAAGYYVMRMLYPRRSTVIAFVLLTAVFTDAIAIALTSARAPGLELHLSGFGLLLLALLSAVVLRRQGVKSFVPYWLVSGTLSWFALYWLGIHPALALVPIVPLLPHDHRGGDVFADRDDHNPIHHAEHQWNGIAQVAVFLFGLVNAGVIISQVDTGTWAVVIAAVVGRPLGIILAVAMAMAAGMRLPKQMQWADVTVAALATTSGFTFALFLATAALPVGAVAQQVTIGALLTVTGAFLTLGLAWVLGVGRFKPLA
ncbi:MAG TPA: Na+/H+ antiporter NhaA [Vicinamibacterales bacterium]|nr:Na+/H+ antiporter NhaA [Vicinamibacterales bacterium]